jgi:hypothetical protein
MMLKITNLQSAGTEREVFAKYLGRRVQVRGTRSSGQNSIFKGTSIGDAAANWGEAK